MPKVIARKKPGPPPPAHLRDALANFMGTQLKPQKSKCADPPAWWMAEGLEKCLAKSG